MCRRLTLIICHLHPFASVVCPQLQLPCVRVSDRPFVPFLERLALLLMGDLLKILGSVAAFLEAHDILIRYGWQMCPSMESTSLADRPLGCLGLQRVVDVGVSSWTIPLLGYPILAHTQMVGLPLNVFLANSYQFLPLPSNIQSLLSLSHHIILKYIMHISIWDTPLKLKMDLNQTTPK